MNELMRQFHEKTDNAYGYIKLSGVDVNVPAACISVSLIYPESNKQEIMNARETLADIFRTIINSPLRVDVHFRMSHFDENFFKARVIDYFKAYPTISPYVFADEIVFSTADDGISATLTAEQSVCESIKMRKLDQAFQRQINDEYCEPVFFKLNPKITEAEFDSIDAFVSNTPLYVLENEGGRYIRPENVEELIGAIIYEPARYIEDCKRQETGVVICGKMTGVEKRQYHAKKDNEEKTMFKFDLEDISGAIKCVHFPKKGAEHIDLTEFDGKEVVVRGELKPNTFKNNLSMEMTVRHLCLCTLPEGLKQNRIIRLVPEQYEKVFPEPFKQKAQMNLFDVAEEIPEFLLGKTFCIIDLETTGVDQRTDKIIEFGGVKMVDGVITETFSSLIDPGIPLPAKITELTGITNDDLNGAPSVDAVMPDFYKFTADSILVGHNVSFDIGFLNAEGQAIHIYFDQEKMDTYILAQRYLKGLSNFKLKTVIKHFGIENEHAHRAVHDCIATAEAFKKLAAYIKN